jgi:chemotaxis protein methyltransferase CheR
LTRSATNRLPQVQFPVLPLDEPELSVPYLISQQQFNLIRDLARKHAGIHLADHKKSMVQRRVTRRISQLGFDGFSTYCDYLQTPEAQQEELQLLINALTTNKTDFFRENHHFEHLGQVAIPHIMQRVRSGQQKRIRIWSAGCSSGQEPYTIAMTMMAAIPDIDSFDAKILATDIDTEVLARAAKGIYEEHELTQLPATVRANCFKPDAHGGKRVRIDPAIQRLVTFRQLNLHDQWPMSGPFDIIFCRNVVIYFDKPTQIKLFDRFADILSPQGLVYIGHSESLFRVSDRFQFEGQSTYRKIQ